MVDALTSGDGDRRRREVEALLVLEALPGVGPRRVQRILHAAGSAVEALAHPGFLEEWVGKDAAASARSVEARDRARGGVEDALRWGMEIVTYADPSFPPALRQLADPPPVLFLRGNAELLGTPGVAIVGARKATARARQVAHRLGAAVARTGVPVVSGLALGVDGAAHRGALEAEGPTVAVLGRGADRAYPSSHHDLFRQVVARGLVVSEFVPGTPALPYNFPRRNRILAGLASTLVVVEAAARSGALISVDHALDLGVDVWAVPGPFDEPACAGSNELLADGARPLTSVGRFLEAALGVASSSSPTPSPSPEGRDGPESLVLAALARGGLSVDEVARVTGVPVGRVVGVLTALELQGRVTRMPGMRFGRAG